MSDLDSFFADAMGEAAAIIGTSTLTISGIEGSFTGILDRQAESSGRDTGGFLEDEQSILVCPLPQFAGVDIPQHRDCSVDGRDVYTIDRFDRDSGSITFYLGRRTKGTRS